MSSIAKFTYDQSKNDYDENRRKDTTNATFSSIWENQCEVTVNVANIAHFSDTYPRSVWFLRTSIILAVGLLFKQLLKVAEFRGTLGSLQPPATSMNPADWPTW